MTKRFSFININFPSTDPKPPSAIESREGQTTTSNPDRADTDPSSTEYGLRIDEQTETFLELKQKLTYFLITASVAVVAFLISYIVDNQADVLSVALVLASLASLSGLLVAGCSILSLHKDIGSYRLHLKYRYQRRDPTRSEISQWDDLNRWS